MGLLVADVGELIAGRYRLDERLGAGAMGQVWLAQDELLHRKVAIKRLLFDAAVTEPADLERAMREARLASRLNHPHAVAVYDLLLETGRPVLVMEYVSGRTLAQRIRDHGPLSHHEAATLVGQVAEALAAAHQLDIVHRDIKPGNILITGDGRAKLADFGIARSGTDASLTGTGTMMGTIAYMAPEIADGDPATKASDVWSLGVTLYNAVEGVTPFEGTSAVQILTKLIRDPIRPPLNAGPLVDVLHQALDRDPAKRPTAAAMVVRLEDAAAHASSTSQTLDGDAETSVDRSEAASSVADVTVLRNPATTVRPAGPPPTELIPVGEDPRADEAAELAAATAVRVIPAVTTDDQHVPTKRSPSMVAVALLLLLMALAGVAIIASGAFRTGADGQPQADPTPTGSTYRCWNGTQTTSAAACPRPSGFAGVQAAFPALHSQRPCGHANLFDRRIEFVCDFYALSIQPTHGVYTSARSTIGSRGFTAGGLGIGWTRSGPQLGCYYECISIGGAVVDLDRQTGPSYYYNDTTDPHSWDATMTPHGTTRATVVFQSPPYYFVEYWATGRSAALRFARSLAIAQASTYGATKVS